MNPHNPQSLNFPSCIYFSKCSANAPDVANCGQRITPFLPLPSFLSLNITSYKEVKTSHLWLIKQFRESGFGLQLSELVIICHWIWHNYLVITQMDSLGCPSRYAALLFYGRQPARTQILQTERLEGGSPKGPEFIHHPSLLFSEEEI